MRMKKWFRPLPIDWLEWTLALALLSLFLQVASPEIGAWLNRPRPGRQVAQRDGAYPYLVYLPDRSDSSPERTTLLLSLHGSGARGADLDPRRLGGPASLIADGKSFPMIVVSPQCPVDHAWEADSLQQLLESLQNRFQPQRVVITGYSMGGGGTWEFAQTYPELVDAAAPVAAAESRRRRSGSRTSRCGRFMERSTTSFPFGAVVTWSRRSTPPAGRRS